MSVFRIEGKSVISQFRIALSATRQLRVTCIPILTAFSGGSVAAKPISCNTRLSSCCFVFWATVHVVQSKQNFPFAAIFSAIIVLIFIDLNHRNSADIIACRVLLSPDSAVQPGEDGTSKFLPIICGFSEVPLMMYSFLDSLIGALVCGGFLWFVAEAYFRFRKIEGLGFGDIKLMGMVGAFLGVRLALLTIMLGSLMGALVGFIFIKAAGKEANYELPFGSFLGVAAILSAFGGADD
jgi:prepilin signal peptidase PulO-like enzyme (type II secretory pathway)